MRQTCHILVSGLAVCLALAGLGLTQPLELIPLRALPSAHRKAAELPCPQRVPLQIGLASWYGGQFNGRQTTDGETFHDTAMTAAHPTLPFNTLVRVTNLCNDHSAIVRINDRGPVVRGRIIDLSRAAARRLGFAGAGVTPVRIDIVKLPGKIASRG